MAQSKVCTTSHCGSDNFVYHNCRNVCTYVYNNVPPPPTPTVQQDPGDRAGAGPAQGGAGDRGAGGGVPGCLRSGPDGQWRLQEFNFSDETSVSQSIVMIVILICCKAKGIIFSLLDCLVCVILLVIE